MPSQNFRHSLGWHVSSPEKKICLNVTILSEKAMMTQYHITGGKKKILVKFSQDQGPGEIKEEGRDMYVFL